MQIVGILMYLTATRPDLIFVASLISRFTETPTEKHLMAAKKIIIYLKGSVGLGILYRRNQREELIAYSNSDYAEDVDDKKSTLGYAFMMGSGAISWYSRK